MPDEQTTKQTVEAQNSASFPVEQMIERLRCCANPGVIIDECDTVEDCPYADSIVANDESQLKEKNKLGEVIYYCGDCMNRLMKDAATMLEAQQGQIRDQAFLIELQIDTVDRLQTDVQRQHKHMLELARNLPKRGEWKKGICQVCGFNWGAVAPIAGVPKYCPSCGSRNK